MFQLASLNCLEVKELLSGLSFTLVHEIDCNILCYLEKLDGEAPLVADPSPANSTTMQYTLN